MKRLIMIAGMVVAFGLGSAAAFAATSDKPPAPPGQPECEHGNSQKPCKDDPQPNHGQDCEEHGNQGGQNEDHCKTDTTPTDTTTTDDHDGDDHDGDDHDDGGHDDHGDDSDKHDSDEHDSGRDAFVSFRVVLHGVSGRHGPGDAARRHGERFASAGAGDSGLHAPDLVEARAAHVGGGRSGQQDGGGSLDGGTAGSVHALA